jgi:tRNA/rRNA methyltransferase
MAGTNRNRVLEGMPSSIPGPAIILVEPQMGENIGAACRAMWNFGLTDLRLVAPRDGWPNEKAVAMASGAAKVIEHATVFTHTASATQQITTLYATTARERDMTKRVLCPRDAVSEMCAKMQAGEKVGVLFGRERTGLENDDITRSNAIIAVPANPIFASLNLAQCVLLIAYEWRQVAVNTDFQTPSLAPNITPSLPLEEQPADCVTVDFLHEKLVAYLDEANYFWPEIKRAAMMQSLRNLLSRTPMTKQDVRMMHGVYRTLAEERQRRKKDREQDG